MNRHHPYGGYDEGPRRRSASPPHRGGGGYRGRGGRPPRGRGGYGGGGGSSSHAEPTYDAYASHSVQQDPYGVQSTAYGSGLPSAPIGNDYSTPYGGAASVQRDPFYANGDPPATDYQDYSYAGNNEYNANGNNSRGGYEGGRGRGGATRGRPRHRDDKVHDSIIEERINRERPCRTLFIRNIKYESSSEDMRAAFEAHGEIKTFFDLIKTRGMVFVTYFDLRAAERARERLQGMDVSGREIDVHYSLPREHELSQRCDREKNQGTLLATLVDSPSRQPIDEMELRRRMLQIGEIKHIKPLYIAGLMRPDQRVIEFYDSRNCILAHDRMRDQHMQDGILDLQFEWDVPDQPLPDGPVPIPIGNGARSPPRYGDRGGAPFRGSGSDRGALGNDWERSRDAPPPFRDDYPPPRRDYPGPDRADRGRGRPGGSPRDRRPSFPPLSPIADRGGPPPYSGGSRDGDYGRDSRDRGRGDRGGRADGFERGSRGGGFGGPGRHDSREEWRGRAASPVRARVPPAPGTDEFGRSLPPGRADPPPAPITPVYSSFGGVQAPTTQNVDERLEQAKKVQQLLAALKPGATGPQSAPAPAPPPQMQPPSSYYGAVPQTSYPPAPQYSTSYPSSLPQGLPQNPMSSYPPASAYSQNNQIAQAPAVPANVAGVQNLLALLAQNQQKGQMR